MIARQSPMHVAGTTCKGFNNAGVRIHAAPRVPCTQSHTPEAKLRLAGSANKPDYFVEAFARSIRYALHASPIILVYLLRTKKGQVHVHPA